MIFRESDFATEVKPRLRDGEGDCVFTHLLPGALIKNIRLFSLITLEQGCAIGIHTHENEAEIYYVLYGNGIVTDDGVEKPLNQGDCHLCLSGHSHGIINKNEEPLVFLAVIPTE